MDRPFKVTSIVQAVAQGEGEKESMRCRPRALYRTKSRRCKYSAAEHGYDFAETSAFNQA